MDLQSPKILNLIHEDKFEIINGQYLKYAILENNSIVITQSNFFDYIGISKKDKNFKEYPNSGDVNVFYRSKTGNVEIGIPVIEIPAICISTVQLHSESNKFEDAARNAAILLMYLANEGLAHLISEKTQSEFDNNLAGLKNVPPLKRKKK
jgi:hypothetical protein